MWKIESLYVLDLGYIYAKEDNHVRIDYTTNQQYLVYDENNRVVMDINSRFVVAVFYKYE